MYMCKGIMIKIEHNLALNRCKKTCCQFTSRRCSV